MSLTNNKIKSTTIYGALNVLDMVDNSVLSSAYIKRNLTVDGNINNVPNSKFAYLTNITSDVQASLNASGKISGTNAWTGTNTFNTNIPTTTLTPTLSTQLITKAYADANYVGSGILSGTNTWTGTNAYNTNLPTSTLTPTIGTQLVTKTYADTKASLSGNNTFTGINTTGGLTINGLVSNGNKGILQLNDFNSLSSGFYSYIHNSSGINSYRSLGNLGTTTSHYFATQNSSGVESYTMTLQNNLINLNQPTVISGSLNVSDALTVNAINMSHNAQLIFPSSLPTTTSTNAGLGITWNDPASGIGIGTGRTNFINYGQGGSGGFTFTNVSLTASPITNMTITPTTTNITGNTTITGSLTVSSGLNFNNTTLINNKITNLNQLVFDNISDTADKIILYNGGTSASSYTMGVNAGVLYYNSNGYHNFYSGGTSTTALLILGPTSTTINTPTNITGTTTVNGNLNVTGTTTGITATMVGLGSVNNTSDLSKPISTLTQSALDSKANLTGANTFTGTLGVGNTFTTYDNTQTVNTSYYTTITQAAGTLQIKSRNAIVTTPGQTSIQFTLEDPGHNLPVVMELNSNTIKIYKPIQLSYSSFTTPAITYVGGLYTGTYNTTLPTNGAIKSIVTMSMPIGVWAFSGNISYNATNIVSSKLAIVEYTINSFSSPAVTKTQTINASSMCDNISTILPVPSATTYYLTVLLSFTGTLTTTADNLPFLRATRIA